MTQPGWYPNGQNGLVQWWDGRQWHPAPPQPAPAPHAAAPLPAYQPDPYAVTQQIPAQPHPVQAMAFGSPAVPGPGQLTNPHGYDYRGPSTPTGQPESSWSRLWSANKTSAIVVIVSLVYLLVDLVAGFTIFGIVPIAYSITAFRRREKLAPVALVCAVGIVVLGLVLR